MRQTQCPNFCAAVGVRHLTFSVNATFMKQLDKNKIGMFLVVQHEESVFFFVTELIWK